jgi:hypothetical protein
LGAGTDHNQSIYGVLKSHITRGTEISTKTVRKERLQQPERVRFHLEGVGVRHKYISAKPYQNQLQNIEDFTTPFGYINNGMNQKEYEVDSEGTVWETI